MAMLTHPHAFIPVRPSNEDFERNVRAAVRDSGNAISVAWLASECRRARFEETQLREELERVSLTDVRESGPH
jgi:hypothetical protein